LGALASLAFDGDTQDYNENCPKLVLAFLGAEAEDIRI
jgi:hypothetical protein